MKSTDRVLVYLVGFILGMLLVSMILSRRAAKEETAVDPWVAHNAGVVIAGTADPLPSGMPASIQRGKIMAFGFLPSAEAAAERVWLLNFEKSYPYVRAVEDLASGEFSYMAADQIAIELAEGVDVTELKPMPNARGLPLRMLHHHEHLAVLGVLRIQLDELSATRSSDQQ